jgi:hypothetical protein
MEREGVRRKEALRGKEPEQRLFDMSGPIVKGGSYWSSEKVSHGAR